MKNKRGFTLIELLVVVAIITLLIAILLPSLNRSIALARDVQCRSQLRSTGQAFLIFASDHFGVLPGNFKSDYAGPEPWQKSWLGNEVWPGVSHEGTLLQYIGGKTVVVDRKLYRCPDLPDGKPGSGIDSNTYFDYAALLVFSGAKISNMPGSCDIQIPGTTDSYHGPTPLIAEEDPYYYLNRGIEPGFSNYDQAGNWHRDNTSNAANFDGSVIHFQWDTRGAHTIEMTAKAPSGATVTLNGQYNYYGSWNSR